MRRYQSAYKPRSIRKTEKKTRQKIVFLVILLVVGAYLLISWGLPALVGSLSVFNKLQKTQSKSSIKLEDSAIAPPVLNIPYEATNSSSIKITGYTTPASKVEIYIDDDLKTIAHSDSSGNFIIDSLPLTQGINSIYGKTVNDKGYQSLPSKNIKLTYSNEKPSLEIYEPKDNQEIKGGDKKIKIAGHTDPANNITINGSTVITGNEGNFSTEIPLNEGDNHLSIVATNQINNTAQINLKVKYTP